MEIPIDQSCYFNPNTRQLTSDPKNTIIKDRDAFNESMQKLLNPIDDLAQVLNTPIKLARSPLFSKMNNSVHIAQGQRIRVNGGHVLTVKTQGVEVSGGSNPYDTEAYIKAQQMADSLASLLRNACGTLKNMGYSEEDHNWYTEGITNVLSYLGIDTSKEFSVNGMRYHKDENGWYESEANRAAQEAYERLTANNRTYLLADERTKKQIAYISDYYLENTTEKLQEAWQKTLEETSVNPFPEGFSNTLSRLAMEQDFATGGNDDIFGSDLESNIEGVRKIIERLENPTSKMPEKYAEFVANETKFYTALLNNLT